MLKYLIVKYTDVTIQAAKTHLTVSVPSDMVSGIDDYSIYWNISSKLYLILVGNPELDHNSLPITIDEFLYLVSIFHLTGDLPDALIRPYVLNHSELFGELL